MNNYLGRYILNKYQIVSFDIFDTLIERDVYDPTDIFELVGKKLNCDGFKRDRIEAEKKARFKKLSGEVSLREIYEELEGYENLECIMSCEIDTELEHIHTKQSMLDFFSKCTKHKVVILVSDMYLKEDVIRNLLCKCGISGFSRLYISCEYNRNKRSGELFDYIFTENGWSKKDAIHIGDSMKADIMGARKAGIQGILVTKSNLLKRCFMKIEKKGKNLFCNFFRNKVHDKR